MIVRRYMHLSGATNADFGVVWVADRYHGAVKPKAHFYGKPIRLEDHQNSRWIAEPLRLPEWCHDTDGAVTIVVTWLERARDLPNRPVIHRGRSAWFQPGSVHDDELLPTGVVGLPEMGLVGRQPWPQSGSRRTTSKPPCWITIARQPLHAVNADSVGRVGFLRPMGSKGLHRRRRDRNRRAAADQRTWRPTGRGVYPRHEWESRKVCVSSAAAG